MLDAIDPTDSAVWFIIYVLIGTAVMSEGLIREWASSEGTLGDVFDLNKAAPTLGLGALGGAVVFGLGGSVDPGLFEVVIAALVPILDNLRSVARAVSGAVTDERESGGDSMEQAIAGGRAARDEFDREAWDESRRRVEEGLEDADGPTPTATENVGREVLRRFDSTFGGEPPTAGPQPASNAPNPEPGGGTDGGAPGPIGEAEDEGEGEETVEGADAPAPIGEAEDAALGERKDETDRERERERTGDYPPV